MHMIKHSLAKSSLNAPKREKKVGESLIMEENKGLKKKKSNGNVWDMDIKTTAGHP